jgi:hypothetical protein
MFKTIMIIGVVVVGLGWIAYGIYEYKMRQEEKKNPPVRSERFDKSKSEVSDWAKQMASFKKPVHKKPDQDNKTS